MKEQDKFWNTTEFLDKVHTARVVYVFILLVCLRSVDRLDAGVDSLWETLSNEEWFQHDSFEPVWATFCFALWMILFDILAEIKPLQRYLINKKSQQDDTVTFGVQSKAGLAYLIPILVYDVFYPRRKLPTEGPGGFFKVVGDIAFAIFVYDLLFFPLHVAMHKVKRLRNFHVLHHENKGRLKPQDTLRHSIVDGTMQVATNIVVLNTLKLHPFTRMWYNFVITEMLVSIHSGLDFPWMAHNVVPFGILGGSRRHEQHHSTGTEYFQQFFTYLDDSLFSH